MRNIKKTILVTGGSRGIGLAITKELLKKRNLIYLNHKTNTPELEKFFNKNQKQIIPLKANLFLKKEIEFLLKILINYLQHNSNQLSQITPTINVYCRPCRMIKFS